MPVNLHRSLFIMLALAMVFAFLPSLTLAWDDYYYGYDEYYEEYYYEEYYDDYYYDDYYYTPTYYYPSYTYASYPQYSYTPPRRAYPTSYSYRTGDTDPLGNPLCY